MVIALHIIKTSQSHIRKYIVRFMALKVSNRAEFMVWVYNCLFNDRYNRCENTNFMSIIHASISKLTKGVKIDNICCFLNRQGILLRNGKRIKTIWDFFREVKLKYFVSTFRFIMNFPVWSATGWLLKECHRFIYLIVSDLNDVFWFHKYQLSHIC